MRILTLVTLISPDGEYGGPVRVAVNQARELRDRGHDVTLVAAARGFPHRLPDHVEDVPAALFPARSVIPGVGFAGLSSPGLQRALPHLARGVDIMHVNLARDLVTLPAAAWARRHHVPYVLQTHGMIDLSRNPLARPLDAFLTRPVLRDARRVFYLTERERQDLGVVAGSGLPLQPLANGVPVPASAHAAADGAEVLYLSRLAPRKRPTAFVEMSRAVAQRFPAVRFRLAGPDEGEGPAVERLVHSATAEGVDVRWEGPVPPEDVTARMAQASVFVLPSVDEPYPMAVLEAMALGLPVVITDSCGLAGLVREAESGLVVDDSQEALTRAVTTLLADPDTARTMGGNGRTLTRDRLAMSAIAAQLEAVYAGA